MDVSEAQRLKAVEGDSAKLKRMLAELMLANVGLKNRLGKSGDTCCVSRGGAHLKLAYGMSERQACWALIGQACAIK